MKLKLPLGVGAALAIATALLAVQGSSTSAQPIASIALPQPGGSVNLYSGCNNITLTFEDGTPSEDLVQAVTPPASVESLWRHSAVLARFEGFNPAFPGASDLPSVDFLDAVWLCMVEAPGTAPPPPPPAPTATPTSPSAPPPPPPPPPTATPTSPPPAPAMTPETVLTADLAPTDVYTDFLPVGSLYIRITNHGPHSVQGVAVDLSCYLWWWNASTPLMTSQWINPGVVIHLDPGQTVEVPMNAQVDTDQYSYVAGCDLGVPFNIDPNPHNNSYSENIP